jgi:hypothetical protein
MKTILPYIALAMFVASIGYAFYLREPPTDVVAPIAGGLHESAAPTTTSTSLPSSAAPTAASVLASTSTSQKTYTNPLYHFSFRYPKDLVIDEQDGADGSLTLAFQDPTTNEGFEVYVTPYSGTQITKQEFQLDEPSGVIQEQTDVMIDGVRATMFYGNNTIMGDTREVWFINGGYLYEVATYKQLDAWLGAIMQTWQFTPLTVTSTLSHHSTCTGRAVNRAPATGASTTQATSVSP